MKMYLTQEQAIDLIESEKTIHIGEHSGKHDCHWDEYVTEINGKHYRFNLEFSYNNGIQLYDSLDLTEVKPVEKTITEWVPV